MGLFPTVNWIALIIFDITCLMYLGMGIYFVRTGFVDGVVSSVKLKAAKIFLVNAKKDEMERNNERVQNVLTAVSELSDNLLAAGSALSQISENESASAQQLAATSETLLIGSNALEEKADKSIENLNKLRKWADVVNTNVEKVERTCFH